MKPRENVMMRMDATEVAVADAVTERMGARNRSAAIRELISEKARKLRIKRTSPEVLARLACGTEDATDGEEFVTKLIEDRWKRNQGKEATDGE